VQCAMKKNPDGTFDETTLVFEYLKAFDIVREIAYPKAPARALFLGGCNYSYPRFLLSNIPELAVDVVEIDPGMTETAKKYFGFEVSTFPTLNIFHEDARTFFKKERDAYDIIFMDTFGSSKGIPVHLTTEEMFLGVEKNLNQNGYLVVNVHGAYFGEKSLFPSALLKTMRQAFKNVSAYHMGYEPQRVQNLIYVATNAEELPETLISSAYPDLVLRKAVLPESEILLTDDFAPVERLMN
jgi:spermidine synthase